VKAAVLGAAHGRPTQPNNRPCGRMLGASMEFYGGGYSLKNQDIYLLDIYLLDIYFLAVDGIVNIFVNQYVYQYV